MKSTSIIVPIAILAIGGIWILNQLGEISELKNKSAALERQIVSAPQARSGSNTRTRKTALDRKHIDWGLVARELQNKSGYGIFKASLRLEEQLRDLSAQELKDALAKAEEANLDKDSFRRVTGHLLKLLLKADPSHILTHASGHPDVVDLWFGLQGPAMIQWAKKSPSDAITWFDSQSPDAFPLKHRKKLQHGIISSLTIVDFEQAKNRLAGIPEDKRFDFFNDYYSFGFGWREGIKSGHNLTGRFAELTRLLPENRHRYIAVPLTWLGEQDRPTGINAIQLNLKGWGDRKRGKISLEVIHDYFQKIQPTPAEIDICINAIISEKCLHLPDQPEREPEALRNWLRSELNPNSKTE